MSKEFIQPPLRKRIKWNLHLISSSHLTLTHFLLLLETEWVKLMIRYRPVRPKLPIHNLLHLECKPAIDIIKLITVALI